MMTLDGKRQINYLHNRGFRTVGTLRKLLHEVLLWSVHFPYRWIILFLPRGLSYRLSTVLGTCQAVLIPRKQTAQWIRNVRTILGSDRSTHECRQIIRQYFVTGHKNFVDLVLASKASLPEMGEFISEIDGRHHLDNAVSMGKGVVVVSAHLGPFKLLVTLLASEGYKTTLFMRTLPAYVEQHGSWVFPRIFRSIKRVRDTLHGLVGERMLRVEANLTKDGSLAQIRSMYEHLAAGEVLVFSNDRILGKEYLELPFCQGHASFSLFPVRLAAHKGIPLVPIYSMRLADNRHKIVVKEPIRLESSEAGDIRSATEACVKHFAECLIAYPGQWRVWPDIHIDLKALVREKNTEFPANRN